MKRSIRLDGIGTELILSKATAVRTTKQMIHFDQLEDGTWRLIYNANLIPDITQLTSLTIIRDNNDNPRND